MALTKCKKCGGMFASFLKTCPHCSAAELGLQGVHSSPPNTHPGQEQAIPRSASSREPGVSGEHSGKAVASMVLGIVGLFTWPFLIGLPTAIVGLVLSKKGLNSQNRGMAVAGLVMCIISLALAAVTFILAFLLGVLTPLAFLENEAETAQRALGDCRNISTAVLLFHKDTGTWPYYDRPLGDPKCDYLYGNMGDMPSFTPDAEISWGYQADDMYFHLVMNGRDQNTWRYRPKKVAIRGSPLFPGWDGPYLPYVTDDPWGHKYLMSVGAFEYGRNMGAGQNHVWCLSAGPNGIVETPISSLETLGDDIGYRTK